MITIPGRSFPRDLVFQGQKQLTRVTHVTTHEWSRFETAYTFSRQTVNMKSTSAKS